MMWLPVTGGCVQGPLQFDAHQNLPLLKEKIGCTPGSWVFSTSDLGSAGWWDVWETWKNTVVSWKALCPQSLEAHSVNPVFLDHKKILIYNLSDLEILLTQTPSMSGWRY